MADKNDVHEEVEEVIEEEDLSTLDDATDWKAKAQEIEQKRREDGIRARERTKALKDQLADAKKAVDAVKPPKTTQDASKANGLDENALDYLDVKGVSEREDIKIIEDIVKKTGMSVREALKDEYVQAKLTANKAAREVKEATPSSTKRAGGNQGTDLSAAIARYEQSGYDAKTLPDDFKQRSAIINAVAAKQSTNKPSWQS